MKYRASFSSPIGWTPVVVSYTGTPETRRAKQKLVSGSKHGGASVGARGYHPRKTFETVYAKSCNLYSAFLAGKWFEMLSIMRS